MPMVIATAKSARPKMEAASRDHPAPTASRATDIATGSDLAIARTNDMAIAGTLDTGVTGVAPAGVPMAGGCVATNARTADIDTAVIGTAVIVRTDVKDMGPAASPTDVGRGANDETRSSREVSTKLASRSPGPVHSLPNSGKGTGCPSAALQRACWRAFLSEPDLRRHPRLGGAGFRK
jgi:hypothetical protein